MSRRRRVVAAGVAVCIASAGCATTDGDDAQNAQNAQILGAILGGLAGGVAGRQVGSGRGRDVATLAGVIAGAMIGGAIAKHLSAEDRRRHQAALNQALSQPESGPTQWQNSNAGTSGAIIPLGSTSIDGRQCREVTETINVRGRQEEIKSTYCRESDGSFALLN